MTACRIKLLTLALVAGLGGFTAQASDRVPSGSLSIDRTVIGSSELQFANDKNIYPKASDFQVLNYVLMSSNTGERWATLTLRNTADGSRQFASDHIMALFANGKRHKPSHVKRSFKAGQILTFSLNFGSNKFPLLEIYTRN